MKHIFITLVIALTSVTAVQAQSKVAHVNSQQLLDTMPSRKKAIAEIAKVEQAGLEELKEMDAAVQKTYAEYMKVRPTLSQPLQEYEEGRIQKMQAGLESRQNEIDQLLQKMSQDMNVKILASVKEAVDVVAKRKGLNYVIDESSTLFASGTNITNETITELLRIDAEKNKAP